MTLQSKSTQLGGGYWILTEFVTYGTLEWAEYRLFKDDCKIAWCINPREGGHREVWWRNDKAKAYQEYLQSGFARYPFV